ncbi:MAG: 2-dehydro-3-deoxygalactonokinase [Silicimonas sp.]|nr:2-dehydro-3-deoxygalactonokinase [Silicimonas sp.]
MNSEASYADWIAVDWGTSRVRAWAMKNDVPIAEAHSDQGMGTLAKDAFESALLALIDPWLGVRQTKVVACGMVGARQGWAEAAYSDVPCTPVSENHTRPPVKDTRIDVHILPGLCQRKPADVMRGEETQIAGYLAKYPDFDGVICLPGTHTKWAQVSAGEVVSFRTFMTGEMFALLSKSSVLRHSLTKGWDEETFLQAVSDGLSRPEAMASRFFSIRAESLLSALDGASATARLSGWLLGAELAAARAYWLGQRVALIGNATLSKHYATALGAQGVATETADATKVTLAGLFAAYEHIKEQVS